MPAQVSQPCPALPLFPRAMAVPSSCADEQHQHLLPAGPGMHQAVQRRGRLVVGAGTELPSSRTKPAGRLLEQSESRYEPICTGDTEKRVNSAPPKGMQGAAQEGDLKVAMRCADQHTPWLSSIIQCAGLQVQLWRGCDWRGHFDPSRGNGDGWEGTPAQDRRALGTRETGPVTPWKAQMASCSHPCSS